MSERGKRFFSQSGPFVKYGTLVFDMVYVSLLWLIFSGAGLAVIGMIALPDSLLTGPIGLLLILLTALNAGPAASACFYVMNRRQRDMDTYVWREFWRSYSRNYKQGMALAVVLNIVLTMLLFGIYQEIVNMVLFGRFVYILIGIQLIFIASVCWRGLTCRCGISCESDFLCPTSICRPRFCAWYCCWALRQSRCCMCRC